MIAELRSIPHPEHLGIANVTGGPLYDQLLPSDSHTSRFGPFKTTADFHRHIRRGYDEERSPRWAEIDELVAKHKGTWPIYFTHGDLTSHNIRVRDDKVVGIIDWDTAGWFPSYWEYASAWGHNPHSEVWREAVDKFLEPLPEDLAMDQLRWRYFGPFGMGGDLPPSRKLSLEAPPDSPPAN